MALSPSPSTSTASPSPSTSAPTSLTTQQAMETASLIYDTDPSPLLTGSTTSSTSPAPSPTGCTTLTTFVGPWAGTGQMAHRVCVVPPCRSGSKKYPRASAGL
jgi:hypothetical protein